MNRLINSIYQNLKNIPGWRTDRKLVAFSVDDYGNVRLASKKARENLNNAGLKVYSRFDQYDTLETDEDINILFDALTSVKDINGHNAIFTPFNVPCNIDFDKVIESDYQEYFYELVSETYQKTQSSKHVYELISQGIKANIFLPQFHGREHFNLRVFLQKLKKRDHDLLMCLNNRSNTSIINSEIKNVKYTAAYHFNEFIENREFDSINIDGLDAFEKVYGYRATHFNPPGGNDHPVIHSTLSDNGIRYFDTALIKYEHQGNGEYRRRYHYLGKKHDNGIYLVRNCVFEPTENRDIDWVSYTLKQIETAFRWNKPAIISSHRVNFCGHIDPKNRETGISALRELLKKIVKRWPDVEFISANKLGELIAEKK
ncbi:MAG: hypothetical protein L6Q66_03070 [Bacteroidia bacterium]|nr:hypothetical protein [Ignavibacteriaceae bacterium]MCK6615931.1 hypothetical protein [Ignavibacteriaceae bacterium]MCK6648616.1 hypothetical protein [Bacteroidia bacterium]